MLGTLVARLLNLCRAYADERKGKDDLFRLRHVSLVDVKANVATTVASGCDSKRKGNKGQLAAFLLCEAEVQGCAIVR